MSAPNDLLYTKTHEWVKKNADGSALVGLTDYAQKELGDLVFVNLPQEGDPVTVAESFADVESVKAVSEVYSPLTGVVAEVNDALADAPETINSAPYDAWLVRVTDITAEEDLLDAAAYEAFCAAQE